MMKILDALIVAILCCYGSLASADPAPFGIEINKTTVEELKSKYVIKDAGINKYSTGQMYDLDLAKQDMVIEGTKAVRIVFDQNNKVVAVIATVSKDRYDALLKMLTSKYKLISQTGGDIGDKAAKFADGNTNITIEAAHLSFKLELSYVDKSFQELILKEQSIKQQETSDQELENL